MENLQEIQGITELLLSQNEDSKVLGIELAKSLCLVDEAVQSLSNEVKRAIGFFDYYEFESWKIILESTTINWGSIESERYTYHYHINCIAKGKKQVIKGSQVLYHFAKKREDLIKELKS